MFNVIGGVGGGSAMLKVMGGVRGVSHVQGDGRGASDMSKVMGGGIRGVSHVECDGRG